MSDLLRQYEYYRDDSAVIYCGDCRMILPMLDDPDLILTDPPYGIGENSKKQQSRAHRPKFNGKRADKVIASTDFGFNGMKSIGIEMEENYCEIAVNRLKQEVLSFE